MRTKSLIIVIILAVLSMGATGQAQQTDARTALLILRILAYQQNLPADHNNITIMTVHAEGNKESTTECDRLVQTINQAGQSMSVGNRPVRAVNHTYKNGNTLQQAARSENAVALYICPGLDSASGELTRVTRRLSILSMSGSEDAVQDSVSIGLLRRGSRLRLVINLSAIRAEGVRMDARFLRFGQVIR